MLYWLVGYLSAGRAEAVLICAYAMPAEAADLIAAGAREKVDVINFQWFQAQWALHGVLLHLRAAGHPMARRGEKSGVFSQFRGRADEKRKIYIFLIRFNFF